MIPHTAQVQRTWTALHLGCPRIVSVNENLEMFS
jgi:hypothetical protein